MLRTIRKAAMPVEREEMQTRRRAGGVCPTPTTISNSARERLRSRLRKSRKTMKATTIGKLKKESAFSKTMSASDDVDEESEDGRECGDDDGEESGDEDEESGDEDEESEDKADEDEESEDKRSRWSCAYGCRRSGGRCLWRTRRKRL